MGSPGCEGREPAGRGFADLNSCRAYRRPVEISGDAGFCSEAKLRERDIRAYLATGRAAHPAGLAIKPEGGPLVQAMRAKIKRAGHRSRYRLRKQIVEPVFGQIKGKEGFDSF